MKIALISSTFSIAAVGMAVADTCRPECFVPAPGTSTISYEATTISAVTVEAAGAVLGGTALPLAAYCSQAMPTRAADQRATPTLCPPSLQS